MANVFVSRIREDLQLCLIRSQNNAIWTGETKSEEAVLEEIDKVPLAFQVRETKHYG